jgi:murein L,D-transpeptidase YafK
MQFINILVGLHILFNAGGTINSVNKVINKNQIGSFLNYDNEITEILKTKKIDKNKISILIEKSKYKLTFNYDGKPIKSYPVVLGFDPVNDKLSQGDGCTPEGKFKIKGIRSHKFWSKFLLLDYPTKDSRKKHRTAKNLRRIPQNAAIGGDIGIHGVPDGMDNLIDEKSNWTLGCISLKNKDINEIYKWVKKGTVVKINH